MKYIRTADLNILKVWLVGGQIDSMGGHADGFNTFTEEEYRQDLKSIDDVKTAISDLIVEFGDEPSVWPCRTLKYYDDYYKFKMPSAKNLDILAKRVWGWVREGRND